MRREAVRSSLEDVQKKVALAHGAERKWISLGVEGRCKLMKQVQQAFAKEAEPLSQLISQEMGKPVRDARGEISFNLDYLQTYLDKAAECLKPEVTYESESEIHEIYHMPYGVIAAIAPWNYPFSNFIWQCAQALIAGNTVVFKMNHGHCTKIHRREVSHMGSRTAA